MPYATAPDGVKLYYEECGIGRPVMFVHEYAGDYRSWEMQVRFLSPPSDVPADGAKYSQDIVRDDVKALMDQLNLKRAHIVGHSMGAYTTLHMGLHYPERCVSEVPGTFNDALLQFFGAVENRRWMAHRNMAFDADPAAK
jgi:pimeloyl-ACP methyl ester carboxylesterase